MVYVDTSLLVAYYCPEAISDQVQHILQQYEQPAVSVLTEVELFSAVAKKVRVEEIKQADAHRIGAQFTSHSDRGLFTMLPVANHHWRLARDWIGLYSTPLRALDALHLAIASAEGLELLTADKSLYQSANVLGVKARLLSG